MHVRDIIAALKKLDPEDESHWTIDGAPRLDALAGLVAVTRQQVAAAAPQFSRTSLDLPDLEAEREAAELKMRDAAELRVRADEAEAAAKRAVAAVAAKDVTIRDSHSLTRQNQAWIEAQNKIQIERVARQRHIDALIKDAGGVKAIGRHPLETNEAARIKAKRRNIQLPPSKP